MTDPILEKINSLSEDAQNAAVEKAKELGFDINKGVVSLTESFTNLNLVRAILEDAIDKGKLPLLPLTLQKDISEKLANVSRLLTSLVSGTDEVVNLTTAVDLLYATIWQYGLQNLSESLLGYEKKVNQLKQLEVEMQQLREEYKSALKIAEQVKESAEESKRLLKAQAEASETIDKKAKQAEESATNAVDAQQKVAASIAASLALIEQSKNSSGEQASRAATSAGEAKTLEGQIRSFFAEIDAYRNRITTTTQEAQGTVKENKEQVQSLIEKLNKLEDQIKDQIERATGFSLFQSFQKRQESIASSKMFWVYALGALVVLSIGITFYVVHTTTTFDNAFFVKLSFSLPLVFAITFCVVQYSRERRLEEEYAFRSNISISLNPYQELVAKLIDKSVPGERDKFTGFLIESVSRVFASPTDKIFDSPHNDTGQTERALKQVTSMVKVVAKNLKH